MRIVTYSVVSILIMMAVTLKEIMYLPLVLILCCFNPYYDGSDSKRLFRWDNRQFTLGVSILIMMAVTLKA